MRSAGVKGAILALAVLCVCVLAAVAVAQQKPAKKAPASTKITGTVVAVDAEKALLTLQTKGGKQRTLKVDAKLLEGLQKGDKVEVEFAGKKVKAIHKQEG
ncbi:MAG: hypothetical protein KatS3mg131_1457 [Candidatus Tectimicrobiota bacterium]|nr:MAG: hypothetical protein KatS3mg131_1457 [Candidatus Tectomicrobia bacterium]